jgi:hypothetical protein
LKLFLLLFNGTANGFYPMAVVLQQDTTHKATQTIKDTQHTMSTTQKSKAILVTGRAGI